MHSVRQQTLATLASLTDLLMSSLQRNAFPQLGVSTFSCLSFIKLLKNVFSVNELVCFVNAWTGICMCRHHDLLQQRQKNTNTACQSNTTHM